MLKLSGVTDKTAEDIFYFGVFCDDDRYLDYINDRYDDLENVLVVKSSWRSPEYEEEQKIQAKWFNDLQISIMKGEVERPDWFYNVEENEDDLNPSSYLLMIPKDEKYSEFGKKISKLLSGVSADGGRDG